MGFSLFSAGHTSGELLSQLPHLQHLAVPLTHIALYLKTGKFMDTACCQTGGTLIWASPPLLQKPTTFKCPGQLKNRTGTET